MEASFDTIKEAAEYTAVLTREGICFKLEYSVEVNRYVVKHTGGY